MSGDPSSAKLTDDLSSLASDLPDQRPRRPRTAVTAIKIVPADAAGPQWRGLDIRGAVLATGSLGAIVFALSPATNAGWTSLHTLGIGGADIFGLIAFALVETHTTHPLPQIHRLADRGVGGGFVMMLAASAVLFGTFLLSSPYLQNVLGASAMETGLAFLPLAIAIAAGVHGGSHAVTHAGVRIGRDPRSSSSVSPSRPPSTSADTWPTSHWSAPRGALDSQLHGSPRLSAQPTRAALRHAHSRAPRAPIWT